MKWYYEGRLINTEPSNNSRYYAGTDDMNRYSLRVLSVDVDFVGSYTVLVTSDERNSSDSVEIRFFGAGTFLVTIGSY